MRPRPERFLDGPNSLDSNGLAVFLAYERDDWKVCLTDVTGQEVFVDMADVDEVIATIATCRWTVDRHRDRLDERRTLFEAACEEAKERFPDA